MKRPTNHLLAGSIALVASLACVPARGNEKVTLENPLLGLCFDGGSGVLLAVSNKLTAETCGIAGDEFSVETTDFRVDFRDVKLASLRLGAGRVEAVYSHDRLGIEVAYTLGAKQHFAEKRVTLTFQQPCGVKRIILGEPSFSGTDLRIVPYRYPKFGRKPGQEPICTYFGRTAKGGLFTGVEMPFDASSTKDRRVALGYMPSLKVAAGEKLVCEPVYFGVYRRRPQEQEEKGLPLRSESDAMVAMTSAILGPPRFGFAPMACGWHSEMEHGPYTENSLAGDMKSLDFLASCGIDWVSDSHPWGGEIAKMNALGANDKYEPGPQVRKFLEHAQKVGVKVAMWLTMTNTHPWFGGKPFRADRPDWVLDLAAADTPAELAKLPPGNCMGNKPFLDWLTRVNLDGLATGYYKSWAMDGDFFGTGGWYTTVVPVKCRSDRHEHLPGDANYACQRALGQLIESVRRHYPSTYIFTCRPPQDLGVWAMRNVDVCFTLLETGTGDNLTAGDQIRHWSRIRVQRDFLPHYLDQPLLFPSRERGEGKPSTWPKGDLDYILLSALSCSPNQLYYLPTKTGIPAADKAENPQMARLGPQARRVPQGAQRFSRLARCGQGRRLGPRRRRPWFDLLLQSGQETSRR